MTFALRDYQLECKETALRELESHRSTLLVLPTGTGKTQIFLSVAEEYLRLHPTKKVIVIAHRQELISQPAERWKKHFSGDYPAIEMGNIRSDARGDEQLFEGTIDDRLIIATVQTLRSGRRCQTCTRDCPDCQGQGETQEECPCNLQGCDQCKGSCFVMVACKLCDADGWCRIREDCPDCFEGYRRRMLKFEPEKVSLVINDEAHHSPCASHRLIDRYFGPGVKVLGVTATPDRADEMALGEVFESVAFEYQLEQAVDDGWLVPIEQQYIVVEGLDFSKVRTTAGDLNEGDLEKIIQAEDMLHKFLTPTIEIAGDEPTLVFMPGVASAQRAAEILNRHKPESAACIIGTTPDSVRKDEIKNFATGRRQYLTSCGVFLEGFDAPHTSVVCMCRPTSSRALYSQAIGRGTRPLTGLVDGLATAEERKAAIANSRKRRVKVLDFVGNSGKHKLVSTADILGGNYPPEIVAKAVTDARESGEAVDIRRHLSETNEEQKRLSKLAQVEAYNQQRAAEARAAKTRAPIVANGVQYHAQQVGAFDVLDTVPGREPYWHKGRKPSARMLETLKKMGVDGLDDLSFWQAKHLIGLCIERRQKNLCTFKQAKLLKKFGFDSDVAFKVASQVIDLVAKNRWKVDDKVQSQVNELVRSSR